MSQCSFYFHSHPQAELTEVRCESLRGQEEPLWSVRGKTVGPFQATGTFQWTRAVQALSLLVVRYVLFSNGCDLGVNGHLLTGGKRTFAAALDRAIRRDSHWLSDMFGRNSRNIAMARYLFIRSNSGMKRPGPVSVAINDKVLPLYSIKIYLNGEEVSDLGTLRGLLKNLEGTFGQDGELKQVVNA